VTGAAAPLAAEGVGLALVVAAVAGGVVIVLLLSVEATESSVVIAGVVRKVALLLSAGVALTSVRCWIMQNFCQSLAPELFSPPPPRTEDFQIAYLYIETNMHLLGSPSSIYCNFQNSKRRRIDEVIQDRSQGSFSRSENRFSRF
jgi:hypothetical protein